MTGCFSDFSISIHIFPAWLPPDFSVLVCEKAGSDSGRAKLWPEVEEEGEEEAPKWAGKKLGLKLCGIYALNAVGRPGKKLSKNKERALYSTRPSAKHG